LDNPWLVLPLIGRYLQEHLTPENNGTLQGSAYVSDKVTIGKGTTIGNGATINGPAWIGENCEIRSGCFIRENVIVGDNVVLGNSCEFKNCIIFNAAQIPHFSYVGDSVVGYKAHLAAGVILSNMRLDQKPVTVATPAGTIDTGLRKFGAVVGDFAEIGCNAVLSPGSIIGRRSLIYPGAQWRGYLAPDSIARLRQQLDVIPRSVR
jgi:NDP-sugar pyrophosphorylase family protein